MVCADFQADQPICPDTRVRSTTGTIKMTCEEQQFASNFFVVYCEGKETVRATCAGDEVSSGGHGEPTTFNETDSQGFNRFSAANIVADRPDPASGRPAGWAVTAEAFGSNQGSTAGVEPPPNPKVTVYAVCQG